MQEILKHIQNNADTIIALCALLVSVASILIGYFSLELQHKHNRLSVRPIGKIHFTTSENSIRIEIRNDGTGPMLCSNVKVYENELKIKNNLRDAMPILQQKNGWTKVSTSSQFSISAGDQKALLEISADYVSSEFQDYYDQVLISLKKIIFELEYRDIYDEYIGTLRRRNWTT
ncbi:MAG: hypothetical protein HY785_22850 [Oscillatoriophycideae cyanobacterium NC_groundwater_1537_Pr4_S-0.65um_50_18]|nr:hypothetical protein [Oscillatoriophycideae cyanobacterium NC_groundwater_1537_Pr4_S-0.65um_50_18]